MATASHGTKINVLCVVTFHLKISAINATVALLTLPSLNCPTPNQGLVIPTNYRQIVTIEHAHPTSRTVL